jgi:DNA-binding SARP family transcriptional activator
MPQLALSVLGVFEARVAGQGINFPTDKTRALLAYLALEAGRPHARLSLAGLFAGHAR